MNRPYAAIHADSTMYSMPMSGQTGRGISVGVILRAGPIIHYLLEDSKVRRTVVTIQPRARFARSDHTPHLRPVRSEPRRAGIGRQERESASQAIAEPP